MSQNDCTKVARIRSKVKLKIESPLKWTIKLTKSWNNVISTIALCSLGTWLHYCVQHLNYQSPS